MKPSLDIFLLSHRTDRLDRAPKNPCLHCVLLDTLPIGDLQSNLLGECRAFFLDFAPLHSAYLGFINARWNEKYPNHRTRLHQLPELIPAIAQPNVVYAPWLSTDWFSHSVTCHPSMTDLLGELSEVTGLSLEPKRPTLWANDFIASRKVFNEWLQFWHSCFGYFHGKYGFDLPFESENLDTSRKPAYFYERVTALYFANRDDLIVAQIP